MRGKVISSASVLSLVLGTILSLSAICSGIGIAKADSVIATIAVGSRPFNIAYDSSNGNLYVGNYNDGTISVISGQTNTVIGSPIPVGGFGIAFDSANGNLYATNLAAPPSAAISVISGQTNTVINRIGLESTPEYIAFDSSNNNLYVTTNFQSNAVSVISGQTNTVVGNPIAVGYVPAGITFDPDNGNLYVANHGTFANRGNTVSVISGKTNTVIGTIPVGLGPYAIAFDSDNGNLYVNNINANTVSVISGQTNTVVGNPISVGSFPSGIAFDSANDNLYVTNEGDNTVSVISGKSNSVIGTIPVGSAPQGIAFDSANGNLYVTNQGSNAEGNTVSVISTTAIPPIPPETTITSAVDGNGSTITNGSTTFSSSIRFTFTATTGTNPVASFECSLDNSTFSSCSSPATLTNLAAGKHTFQVRAVDTSGKTDPTPTSFSWTIATVTPPTKTTITSAVDGNNAPVQNGGTTTSSSIKIAFTATQGSNPIAGFECSLDNNPFSSCSSPAVFNNLATGSHKFAVVAVDTAGNKDPTPAIFSWTILTPAQAIQQLIQLKHSMHLDPLTDGTLDIRLNIALQFSQNNVKSGTCLQLNVFTSQVQSAFQVGHVTSAQASQLIQGAQNIQKALGCTVASSANGIGPLSASPSPPPLLNLTHSQQKQPQTTTSSPSLFQPQSQSPYSYSNQYRYPPQYPYLSQIPQSQSSQHNQLPPVANAGVSQTVNENTKVTLDGRASYSPTGGIIVAYQWTQLSTGAPVLLTGANTANPTFTTPIVPSDTVLAFSLRVLDNHGSISTNPAVVYVMVKHYPNNIGTTGGNTPSSTVIQPQQQHQPIVPNNNEINPHSQHQSPIISIPSQRTVK